MTCLPIAIPASSKEPTVVLAWSKATEYNSSKSGNVVTPAIIGRPDSRHSFMMTLNPGQRIKTFRFHPHLPLTNMGPDLIREVYSNFTRLIMSSSKVANQFFSSFLLSSISKTI